MGETSFSSTAVSERVCASRTSTRYERMYSSRCCLSTKQPGHDRLDFRCHLRKRIEGREKKKCVTNKSVHTIDGVQPFLHSTSLAFICVVHSSQSCGGSRWRIEGKLNWQTSSDDHSDSENEHEHNLRRWQQRQCNPESERAAIPGIVRIIVRS